MCEGHDHDHDHDHHVHGGRRDHGDELRVVITGKGGVGKTSLTALLARSLAQGSTRVLAIDADPQMNLPYALGLPREEARALVPLSRNLDYVEEKTGARPGEGWGLFFRLNPDVGDVVERFGVVGPDGVNLLVMGNTVVPAAGCLCPENTVLAAVADAISLRPDDAILLDTQAGVEHFGRALAKGFRHAVVLTDPTFNGVSVALHTARLARELGIPCVRLAVNRVRDDADYQRALRYVDDDGGFPFTSIHALPWDDRLMELEPEVGPLLEEPDRPFVRGVLGLRDALTGVREDLRCAS